ncbi:hypothetical protein CSB45_03570 [candidate division KSB3 bacterium]|uniref:Outer membrane protein beta-barrel domain-containing protein n=1 Tax=candidate division KSB3 bacterium TaxID=2044937 RepID=A0A2G6E996_9BACT|nr:MAG: hypothetical protein CSB45_03570 [candidate division KSB3 bacterium]PIE29573.1 MAG: hypothetical protein CSA57_08165 [candidate division KSB3 bacterium]
MRKKQTSTTVISLWMTVFGLVFCSIAIVSSPAYALWVGQSQINPFLELKGSYESNIYRVNEDTDSDTIITLSPGVHIEYPTGQGSSIKAVADYRADITVYGHHGDETIDPDEQLNTIDHRLGGYVTFNLPSGLLGKAGYVFTVSSIAPDYKGDTRNDYKQHTLEGVIGYRFADRYKIEFDYTGRFQNFDESEFSADDIHSNTMDLLGFYQIRPKLSTLLGGAYALFDRQDPFIDSEEYRAYGGFEYELSEKTEGLLKVGVASRQFDSDALDDVTDLFLDGHLRSEYLERTQWTLNLFRHYHDTALSDLTVENGIYYISTGFGGSVKHSLATLPNMSFVAELTLSKDSYPDDPDDREDNFIDANVGLNYKFYKYLSLGAAYNYINRDSNIDVRNYTNHLAMMRIRGLI